MEGGGGGGGGGGFGYGNIQANPPLYKPSPPLSAIDRFLWGQNHFSHQNSLVKNKHTLGNSLANGFNSYGSVGVSWPCIRNDHHHIMSLDNFGPFFDQQTCSWLHDINSNPNLGSNEEARMAEKNSKRTGKKKVKVGNSSSLIKGQWTEEEDRKLIKLVKQYGERKWAQIAEKMVGRAGKQCRERWHSHLRPDIKVFISYLASREKDGWSEEEERLLIEAHQMVGNRWAEIAKRIPGRTENTIKNHFNATKRRQNSRRKKKQEQKDGVNSHRTSILQDYIKSNNLIINTNSTTPTTDSSTISADDPMNQFHLSQPEQSESATDDSPPLIPPPTYDDDDELLFIQNFFASTNQHINQPPVDNNSDHQLNAFNLYDHQTNTGHDHHSSLTTSNNNTIIYRNAIQGDHVAGPFYSDMYLSYLLNGGGNPTTASYPTYQSCFNDCYNNDEYMNLDLVQDHQVCSNGRMEMDLIEMLSHSQLSQGSSSSNSNF